MSHLSVRTLIEDTVKAVDDSVRFGYARASDFNSIGIREDERAHLDTLVSNLTYTNGSFNLTRTFNVSIMFYALDDMQGAEEQTAKVLDRMDALAIKFIQKLNKYSELYSDSENAKASDQLEITNINLEPLIKVTKDACTGFALRFNLIVPDDFNYCNLYD